jgi:nucleotide-binding universal stress UspA family protein
VYLIHVAAPEPSFVTYEPGPQHERNFQADTLRKEHRDLQAMAAKLRGEGCDAEALMVQGPTAAKIVEEAQRLDAAMIVMGSHGHGALYDLLVGSVTNGVLRKSEKPVVVVPGRK